MMEIRRTESRPDRDRTGPFQKRRPRRTVPPKPAPPEADASSHDASDPPEGKRRRLDVTA